MVGSALPTDAAAQSFKACCLRLLFAYWPPAKATTDHWPCSLVRSQVALGIQPVPGEKPKARQNYVGI